MMCAHDSARGEGGRPFNLNEARHYDEAASARRGIGKIDFPNFLARKPLISPDCAKEKFGNIWRARRNLVENKGIFLTRFA